LAFVARGSSSAALERRSDEQTIANSDAGTSNDERVRKSDFIT
jgi:hypothetical protein